MRVAQEILELVLQSIVAQEIQALLENHVAPQAAHASPQKIQAKLSVGSAPAAGVPMQTAVQAALPPPPPRGKGGEAPAVAEWPKAPSGSAWDPVPDPAGESPWKKMPGSCVSSCAISTSPK
jgi:hypothetical protein